MNGIDISKWQKGINLAAVPCDFVIVKATQGVSYTSPEFHNQISQAQALGKLIGVYHYAGGGGRKLSCHLLIQQDGWLLLGLLLIFRSSYLPPFIASAAAAIVEMGVAIAQVHKATKFAGGGIVKGTTYSGDMIPADNFVNAGELILNRSQQNAVAQQLTGGGLQNLQLSATVKGEDLRLVLNNNGRRTGRGEYVTTNFR